MKIITIRLQKNQPYREDMVIIQGEHDVYELTGKQIEMLLIEDKQMCEECGDSGEIEVGRYDDITTKKCVCKIKEYE